MTSSVKIISSGLYTTIQDRGRFGYSKYGVPKSGAMDLQSFSLANAILNNDENCAVIEWTMIPPVLEFKGDTIIAVTGAVCIPFLNDVEHRMNCQLQVKKGDVLKLKSVTNGVYGFVGIRYGFQSELCLDSRSQYNMVTASSVLRKNDTIFYNKCVDFSASNSSIHVPIFWNESNIIYAFKGPEFDLLSESQKGDLLHMNLTISKDRNRMAIPLDESLENDFESMLTSPVLPGTVQLTPSGKLIILMRDCQTTGGYPRILQLSKDDINHIAQKRMGEQIKFKLKKTLE
ncbi:biotin-dependent carboxyltransferase family protein [uncultured Aquimarina sp.]|uniref:5-oxoprolinase subunit C family protein n=1 Tax=uncultured Aquimarina sp. TaxID=575652 RepID=UPI002629BB0C|nr:biotin-dependent carboxyltransferase family protein [uncultured Aquimarina sp.]